MADASLLSYAGESLSNLSVIFNHNYFRPPHLSHGRILQAGQRIHESAVDYLNSADPSDSSRRTKAKFLDPATGTWCLIQGTRADIKDGKYKGFEIEKYSQLEIMDQAFEILQHVDGSPDPLTSELASKLELLVSAGEPMLRT